MFFDPESPKKSNSNWLSCAFILDSCQLLQNGLQRMGLFQFDHWIHGHSDSRSEHAELLFHAIRSQSHSVDILDVGSVLGHHHVYPTQTGVDHS